MWQVTHDMCHLSSMGYHQKQLQLKLESLGIIGRSGGVFIKLYFLFWGVAVLLQHPCDGVRNCSQKINPRYCMQYLHSMIRKDSAHLCFSHDFNKHWLVQYYYNIIWGELRNYGKSLFSKTNIVNIFIKFCLVVNFRYCVKVLTFWKIPKLQKICIFWICFRVL